MKKQILFLLLLSFVFCCQKNKPESLTIAAAANMQFAIEALTQAFTKETGIRCETVISSSGKLTAQIMQGAPYDVFVSADMKYPATLFEEEKTIGKPKVYAYGRLVLWTTGAHLTLSEFPTGISVLQSDEVRHIALANPKTAPYGVAAMEVLKHYDLLDDLEQKLVYGESIAQVNQFVTTQSAEFGFTAKSVVQSPKLNQRGRWIAINPDLHSPIAQGLVLLKNAEGRLSQAQKFYNFLFSPKAKEILNNFGYVVID